LLSLVLKGDVSVLALPSFPTRRSSDLNVTEHYPEGVLPDRNVIDEVAAHVIGRARVDPRVPPTKLRVVFGHQGKLHGPSRLELVLRQQLVLELEEQDERQHGKPDDQGANVDLVERPFEKENDTRDEQDPPDR